MNKNELVARVFMETGVPMATVRRVLDGVTDQIAACLVDNDSIMLRNFGTFTTQARAPRMARNPKTNEVVPTPATMVAKFRPSKSLKDAVAGR